MSVMRIFASARLAVQQSYQTLLLKSCTAIRNLSLNLGNKTIHCNCKRASMTESRLAYEAVMNDDEYWRLLIKEQLWDATNGSTPEYKHVPDERVLRTRRARFPA